MYLSKHNISKLTRRLPTRATPQGATHTLVREDKGGVGPRIADPAGGYVQPELHPRKPRVPESERTREVLVPVLQIQLENLTPWPTAPQLGV